MKKIIIFSLILISTFALRAQNCTPVLKYNFDNNLTNTGTQGTLLNGANANSISYTIGKDGSQNSAATFNGTGSKFEIPNALDYTLRTWTLWVNASLIDNEYRIVFDADNPNLANSQTQVFVAKGTDGINYLNYAIGANNFKSKINSNEWNHIALVKDKAAVKLYFNGCLVFTGNDMSNNHADKDGVIGKIVIGRNRIDDCRTKSSGPIGNCFQGSLDDLRVYDCALNADAIKEIAGKSCEVEVKFTNTCCPPWNKEVLGKSMQYKGTGGISDPYTLVWNPSALFQSQMQAYLNYIGLLNQCVTKMSMEFRLHNQGTGATPNIGGWGPMIGSIGYVSFTKNTTGVSTLSNLPAPISLFPANGMLPNIWYAITAGIYHDCGQQFFGKDCAENTIYVRVQFMAAKGASSEGNAAGNTLEISDGKKIIANLPLL